MLTRHHTYCKALQEIRIRISYIGRVYLLGICLGEKKTLKDIKEKEKKKLTIHKLYTYYAHIMIIYKRSTAETTPVFFPLV